MEIREVTHTIIFEELLLWSQERPVCIGHAKQIQEEVLLTQSSIIQPMVVFLNDK